MKLIGLSCFFVGVISCLFIQLTGMNLQMYDEIFNEAQQIVDCVAKEEIVKNLCKSNSILRMAICFCYAQKFGEDLDKLSCVYFIKNIQRIVNTTNPIATELFQQQNLYAVLPLLSYFAHEPIVVLSLAYYDLLYLPEEIRYLTELQHLDLMGNRLSSLPTAMYNLTQLKTLDLRWNWMTCLSDELDQFLRKQHCGYYIDQKLKNIYAVDF